MQLLNKQTEHFEFCLHEGWSEVFEQHGGRIDFVHAAFSRHQGHWCVSVGLLGISAYVSWDS
jgi:hypothetical protein